MVKVLLGISALSLSFTALAGSAGLSWHPSVKPGRCVTMPSPQEEFKWRKIKECDEVIAKGYANGVFVSGTAVYSGGQITQSYAGTVTPTHGFKLNIPTNIDGAKFIGMGHKTFQWIK